jgi:hypothetical protein
MSPLYGKRIEVRIGEGLAHKSSEYNLASKTCSQLMFGNGHNKRPDAPQDVLDGDAASIAYNNR